MYIDKPFNIVNGKRYQRALLRTSFRENGKVRHRTIANLSACSPEEIAAIELALRHKHDLGSLRGDPQAPLQLRQGDSFGAVWLLNELAERTGITAALGSDRPGKLALWQVIARVIDQGSRLSAVRLARSHAVGEILGLDTFNEDHLYQNLAWLSVHQAQIEKRLFERSIPVPYKGIFLYDVTSSYLEGTQNALAAWGYCRDKKKGKMQIVAGLLCDGEGRALSIEVFPGNTSDTKTFASQIRKAAERFGASEVTFVGDRGMIKGPQIKQLDEAHFHYITAISKPQIERLLQNNFLQMDLFDQPLAEVTDTTEQVRYVLRRNPVRAEEIRHGRQSKLDRLTRDIALKNDYLSQHPRAKVKTALARLRDRIKHLGMEKVMRLKAHGRHIKLTLDEEELNELCKLDGCYVIKTDLKQEVLDMQSVHDRYKDLAMVEQAFRTSKTVQLEMRPFYVRCEASTRGHAFVVMLAYRLVQELQDYWKSEDLTVEEGLLQLDALCIMEVMVSDKVVDRIIPKGRDIVEKLVQLARLRLPKRVKLSKTNVHTKTKLAKRR